jgi:hypothetical protein
VQRGRFLRKPNGFSIEPSGFFFSQFLHYFMLWRIWTFLRHDTATPFGHCTVHPQKPPFCRKAIDGFSLSDGHDDRRDGGAAGGSNTEFRLLDGNRGLLNAESFPSSAVSILVLVLKIGSRIRFHVHIEIKKGGSMGNGRATQHHAALEKQQIDISNSGWITHSLVQ